MKKIFEYSLPYSTQARVTKIQEDGSELTTYDKVEKKITVVIKEPTRLDIEAAKRVYQKEWNRCVQDGILVRAVVDKQYRHSNGILTEDEQKQLTEVAERIKEIRDKYSQLDKIPMVDRSQENIDDIKKLVEEFSNVQTQLTQLEAINESLYENTAETIASQRQLAHNIFFLTYIDRDGKVEPFVKGDTLDDKLNFYDSIVDDEGNDEKKERARLYSEILTRNTQYIAWLSRGQINKDQLKEINDSIDNPEKKEES